MLVSLGCVLWAIAAGAQTLPGTAAATAPAAYPTQADLAARLQALLGSGSAAQAHWGVAVAALDGTPLYGLDEAKLFRPASTAKLFTTAAAMSLLGPGARVQTRLTYTGTVGQDGVLEGYLTLHGAGDANLAGATLHTAGDPLAVLDDFAAQVAARGIRTVKQVDVAGWLWDPYPPGWDTGDRTFGFSAPVTGFVLNDNTETLSVSPAATVGQPGTVALTPAVSREHVLGAVTTVPGTVHGRVLLHEMPGDLNLYLIGGDVEAGRPVHANIPVLDPFTFTESAFIDRLAAHGVRAAFLPPTRASSSDARPLAEIVNEPLALPAAAAPSNDTALAEASTLHCNDGCLPLATHDSGPLLDDVTMTLKQSLNLHAEVLLRRLGGDFGRDDTFAQGVRVVRQFWLRAGLTPADFFLFDGSGLSTRDLVTPRAEVQVLVYAAGQPWFAAWKAALPIGGVDGTLLSRFPGPLKGKVLAKTGTLGETRTLAGYLQCASGREVTFSVMEDGHLPGDDDTATLDKVVAAIAETQ